MHGARCGTPDCTYTDGSLVSICHAPGDDEFPALAEERQHKAGKYGTCVSGKSERKQADYRPIGSHMAGRKPVCQGTGEDRKRDEMRQGMDERAVTEPARYAEKRAVGVQGQHQSQRDGDHGHRQGSSQRSLVPHSVRKHAAPPCCSESHRHRHDAGEPMA